MRKNRICFIIRVIIVSLILLLSGCAISQEISIDEKNSDQGELRIQFSDPVRNVKVTIDGKIIDTRRRATKEIFLKSLEKKSYELSVTASSWDLKDALFFEKVVVITDNQNNGLLISVPPKSREYWVYQTTTFIGALAIENNYVRPLLIILNLIR